MEEIALLQHSKKRLDSNLCKVVQIQILTTQFRPRQHETICVIFNLAEVQSLSSTRFHPKMSTAAGFIQGRPLRQLLFTGLSVDVESNMSKSWLHVHWSSYPLDTAYVLCSI